MSWKFKNTFVVVTLLAGWATSTLAGPLMDRIDSGKSIRIGFSNEVPWAYPGDNDVPLGFANVHTLGVLKAMGYDNIEPVVTDWGGLIPGLKANRFDIITGGMYILEARCENIDFSEPMGIFGDAFVVPAGNPKNINSYADIADQGATMVTGAGYNTVDAAKREGVEAAQILEVPGATEILAAMRAGRADAGAVTFFTGRNLAAQSGGELEVTDPNLLPEWTQNWVGIGFRKEDNDFLEAFNATQAVYLGSEEMLAAVAPFEYTKFQVPDPSVKTEWICQNR